MRHLVRYIATHVGEDLSLESLARREKVSPFQLHRAFRRSVGDTPAKFVERARLHQAAHALVFHERSMLEIGLEHGYQNHETFSRAFKRHFG